MLKQHSLLTNHCNYQVCHVLEKVRDLVRPHHLFVSIAAGIQLQTIEKILPERSRVVRIMPNTPCLVGKTAAAYAGGTHATSECVRACVRA